jgi:hypothetical protein
MWKTVTYPSGATRLGENPTTKRVSHVPMRKNIRMQGGIHAPKGCPRANYLDIDMVGQRII